MSRRAAIALAFLVAVAVSYRPSGVALAQPLAPLSPATQQAIENYVRDPNGSGRQLLDAARQEQAGTLNPIHELLIGDAASRAGLYRTAAAWYGDVRDRGVPPQLLGAAEFGLAWCALGRGGLDEARDHLAAAAAADVGQRSTVDFATALLDAAEGDVSANSALATSTNDPVLGEAAPLVGAYARYWSGDMPGAAEAFMAFAVAHPDSRFTDDALYAAATAKRQAGREAEALDDLGALAGDGHARGRVSLRLMELDPRAVMREGMRRDRDLPIRAVSRRVADLLDGDGVRLARAALESSERDDAPPPAPRARVHHRHPTVEQSADHGTQTDGTAPSTAASSPASRRAHDAPAPAAPQAPRFPWATLAVLALLALLGSYLLARRSPPRAPDRRP